MSTTKPERGGTEESSCSERGRSRFVSFFVNERPVSLNDMLSMKARSAAARGRRKRGKGNYRSYDMYASEKREWDKKVAALQLPAVGSAYIHIHVVEPNERRDPDGFLAGATKFTLDSLVNDGVLDGDGWKGVLGLSYGWSSSKNADEVGVYVTLNGG